VLKRELPPLLEACDGHVLGRLAPAAEEDEARRPQEESLSVAPRARLLCGEPPSAQPSQPAMKPPGRASGASGQTCLLSDRFMRRPPEGTPAELHLPTPSPNPRG